MRWMCIALLFLIGGCATAKEPGSVNLSFEVRDGSGRTIEQASPGETVQLVFRLANETGAPAGFSYTFPPHRVIARGPFGNTIWEAHEGMAFIQMMRNETLGAGDAREYAVEWQVPGELAGRVRLEPAFHAFINGQPLRADLSPVSLEIRQGN